MRVRNANEPRETMNLEPLQRHRGDRRETCKTCGDAVHAGRSQGTRQVHGFVRLILVQPIGAMSQVTTGLSHGIRHFGRMFCSHPLLG